MYKELTYKCHNLMQVSIILFHRFYKCYRHYTYILLLSLSFSLHPLDKWSPALQIRTVLLSIQALLSAPNPDDPLANDVAELWKVIKDSLSLSLFLWRK